MAKLFDESLERFASALGVSLSELNQEPDAKKYQGFLSYFERTARIVPLMKSRNMVASWAKTPNKAMDGEAPIDLVFGGVTKAGKLLETVEDVLLDQPD